MKRLQTRTQPCWYPDFRLPASGTVKSICSVSYPVCGILLWKSEQTKALWRLQTGPRKLPLYVSYLLCFHVNSLRSGGTCAFSLYPQALAHSLKPSGYTTFVELHKTEFMYLFCYILLLLFSCSVVSNSLQPHGLQHARFPCPSLSPRVCLNFMSIESVMLFNHLILSPPSPPAFSLFQCQGLFQWVGFSHQVAKVLELQLQHQSF